MTKTVETWSFGNRQPWPVCSGRSTVCSFRDAESFTYERLLRLVHAEQTSRRLSLQGLGDGKPTELLDRMVALEGEHKSGFLFRHLFLRPSLAQVQATLANTAITGCRALAKEADCFFLAGQIGLNNLRLLQLHHGGARFRSRCRSPRYGPHSGRHGAHHSSIAGLVGSSWFFSHANFGP